MGRGEVSPHHPTRGSEERHKPPLGEAVSGAEPRPKMDFMHILEVRKKPPGTPFSVFLSDGGPPKRRGARENFSPFPSLSTGLVIILDY